MAKKSVEARARKKRNFSTREVRRCGDAEENMDT